MKKYELENNISILPRKITDYDELIEVFTYRMRLYEQEFRQEVKVSYYSFQITVFVVLCVIGYSIISLIIKSVLYKDFDERAVSDILILVALCFVGLYLNSKKFDVIRQQINFHNEEMKYLCKVVLKDYGVDIKNFKEMTFICEDTKERMEQSDFSKNALTSLLSLFGGAILGNFLPDEFMPQYRFIIFFAGLFFMLRELFEHYVFNIFNTKLRIYKILNSVCKSIEWKMLRD